MTINGGTGDDTIDGTCDYKLIQYAAGDGNDLIIGYNVTDTVQILSGTVSGTQTSGDDVVIETGGFYLIRPTRDPDLPQGELTSVVYGNGRVNGPVYIIPNVTMASGQKSPSSESMRSDEDQVRVRFYGTYKSQDLEREDRDVYYMNNEGRYAVLNEKHTLKAFRSWIEIVRNNNALPFRFYIDGVAESISDLPIDDLRFDNKVYDLQGRSYSPSTLHQLPSTGQKLLIHNGKKYITR